MTFSLNTTSGFLHLEDHGGSSGMDFARADEADLYADKNGIDMKFCKQCFPGNRNNMSEEEEVALAEAALASRDLTTGPLHFDDSMDSDDEDLSL